MQSSRLAVRAARVARARPARFTNQYRAQSSTSGADAGGHSHGMTALYGGLAGGVIATGLGYGWYHFSGVKSAVNIAHQTKSYFETSKQKVQQSAPEPNEALNWLRQNTSFYAGLVPGGKQYVDSAFKDLDLVREKHGDEVDKIVKEAYQELKDVTSKDLSVSTATDAWQILQKHVKRITELASDSAQDILKNHPQLESKIGPEITRLRDLGDVLGPEAEKMVKDTWGQVSSIVAKNGVSASAVSEIQKLLKEKTDEVKKLKDKAQDKGKDVVKSAKE